MHASEPARRVGRPTDHDLTERLLTSTVHLLAEHGLPLSTDKVASHARAGKAAIYRRWPNMSELVSDALHTCSVVPPAPDTGSTRDDLTALLQPLRTQPSTEDRATAAAAGWALFDDALAAALVAVVRTPLRTAIATIVDAHRLRGARVPAGGPQHVMHLAHALWWHRHLHIDASVQPVSIPSVVDDVMLPLITSKRSSPDPRPVR